MPSQSDLKLLDLAPELVENVIRQVGNKEDLSNLRLACKSLDKPSANELFKSVLITPLEEDINTWNSINQDDTLRHIPRHAIIHTQPDPDDDDDRRGREPVDIDEEFEEAMGALSRFPNLDSVEIRFTADCVGAPRDYNYFDDPAEDTTARESMLKLIFEAIKSRSADKKNRSIRKLTISNLQNFPLPEFTASDLFRDVMGHLEELHISITHEVNEHGPDHDYTNIELQTFPAHLVSDWLKPIAANLKALSIYHRNENWGPFPGYFDPSGLPFPKLETLALGYYTLAHNSDLDWILGIKSLRKLILHNCMIASYIQIDPQNTSEWKVRTHDWTELPRLASDVSGWDQWTYDGKWSTYFDRIEAGLPNLVDLRFDYMDTWGMGDQARYALNDRDTCGDRIFPQRYIVFDNGILPTHWPEAEDRGPADENVGALYCFIEESDGFPNLHKERLEEDQQSLDRLLESVKSRS